MTTATLATLVAAACFVAIAAIVFYKTIVTGEWRNTAPSEQGSWYMGIFYYNPADDRMLLPKRTGLGWTLNFAQPLAVIIAILVVAGIIALTVAL